MRVLVATNDTQGHDHGDYAFTVEGELVLAEVSQCANPEQCGCGRGFPGMASGKSTTTAMIADLPHLAETDLRQAVADWLDRSGWADLFRSPLDTDNDTDNDTGNADEMLDSMVDEHLDVIAEICNAFPVGSVVERSGTLIRARVLPYAA